MPRGGPVRKRQLESDYRFGSTVVAKFTNQIMLSGRKATGPGRGLPSDGQGGAGSGGPAASGSDPGGDQRYSAVGGSFPPGGGSNLPGSHSGSDGTGAGARHSLARKLRPEQKGQPVGGAAGAGVNGGLQQRGSGCQEKGRSSPDRRRQPRLCPFPLVTLVIEER